MVFLKAEGFALCFLLCFSLNSQAQSSFINKSQNSLSTQIPPKSTTYLVPAQRTPFREILEEDAGASAFRKRLQMSGRFGLSAGNFESENSDAASAGMDISLGANYLFTKELKANTALRIGLLSERSQYGAGYSAFENGIFLTVDKRFEEQSKRIEELARQIS